MNDHILIEHELRRCACGDKLSWHLFGVCLSCRCYCSRSDRTPIRWGVPVRSAGFIRGILIGLGVSLLAWLIIANVIFWLFRSSINP